MRGLLLLLTICTAHADDYKDYVGLTMKKDKSAIWMGEKKDIAILRKGAKQLLIDSGVIVNGKLKVNGLDILAQLTSLQAELAAVKAQLKNVQKLGSSWTTVQSSIKKIKPDTAAFKKLVKENWNGDYSPWFRWEVVAKGAKGPQYGDIRVRFKNTYDEWVSSHKGDDVGKLNAYWSASIPTLKITYRDWPGLVRAVMLGEKFGSGPSVGLHYKRTNNGEHYPWWQASGVLSKNGAHDWGGYLCTNPGVCGYDGCHMYDPTNSKTCSHKSGKKFQQVISVCNAGGASCAPSWKAPTWTNVQSNFKQPSMGNMNAGWFKTLVKMNWNGEYSPWIRWEIFAHDKNTLYADIRVRFKNNYNDWESSHKGDQIGKLKAYWSANIPDLKVSYRNKEGLVRAVMMGVDNGGGYYGRYPCMHVTDHSDSYSVVRDAT